MKNYTNFFFADSSHKLLDMLAEFQPEGMFYKYISDDEQVDRMKT